MQPARTPIKIHLLTLKSLAELSKKSTEPTCFNNVLTLKEITDRVLKHKDSHANIEPLTFLSQYALVCRFLVHSCFLRSSTTSGKSIPNAFTFSRVGTPFLFHPRLAYTASFSFSYSASRYFRNAAIFSSVDLPSGS